ncbi:MAG: hypothetical protein ACOY31_01505 [Bacillota bacterium]
MFGCLLIEKEAGLVENINLYERARFYSSLAQLLVGILIALGSRGLVNLFLALRTAGMRKEEGDEQ